MGVAGKEMPGGVVTFELEHHETNIWSYRMDCSKGKEVISPGVWRCYFSGRFDAAAGEGGGRWGEENGGGCEKNILPACLMQMPKISKLNYELDWRKIAFT